MTNTGVWSPDSHWIVYDTRFGEAGSLFDGSTIEAINVHTGEVRRLYESLQGAHCGVATFHPREWKVVFILGPENPTPDWQYSFSHRQGVMVDWEKPGIAVNLDARDLIPPFTPGALRGGSHVHVWDATGDWVSFTYNDALLESELRDIGVSIPGHPVRVPAENIRNHSSDFFAAIVSRTTANPQPGSDEIKRACEEAWVGTNGYVRTNGIRQSRALAFQGTVVKTNGESISEVFIVDLPEDLRQAGDGPLAGMIADRPSPPNGVKQRRLTFTADRRFPGIQGPRHWLRSSPDGSRIAFLMKDDEGIVQLWTVAPKDDSVSQLTHNPWDIASAFTWSPDGSNLAHIMDNSVFLTDAATGDCQRVTSRVSDETRPRPEACVFSPDGSKIAFMRKHSIDGVVSNHVCVVFLKAQGQVQGTLADIKTPNIDALARSGVLAKHGYSTAPQCVPSRAGLLVGKFQGRFNRDSNGGSLEGFDQETTIASRLQKVGYVTAQFGKWHLGPTTAIPTHGFKHVFAQNAQSPFSANITLDGQDRAMGNLPPELYHVDACSRAATAVIERYQNDPFC